MDNSIYEVDKEDYINYLGQLNKEKADMEVSEYPGGYIIKLSSKKDKKHFTTRIVDNEKQEEHYYIFNMPDEDERIPPKPIRKITLETKEEVQAFFDALSKSSRGEKKV